MAAPQSFARRLALTLRRLATWAPGTRASLPRTRIAATQAAPHIRDTFSLDRAMRRVVIALAPCVFMALYNSGYQANVDVAIAGLGRAPGWRGAVLDTLGIGYDTSSLWAAVAHGALYFVPVLAVTVVEPPPNSMRVPALSSAVQPPSFMRS